MCAIFGIIGKYHKDLTISAFEKMKHRGDDENYLFLQDNYLFGSYRLSITNTHIPLKTLTHQDNLDILFNGEIYNYQALGDELNLKNPTNRALLQQPIVDGEMPLFIISTECMLSPFGISLNLNFSVTLWVKNRFTTITTLKLLSLQVKQKRF